MKLIVKILLAPQTQVFAVPPRPLLEEPVIAVSTVWVKDTPVVPPCALPTLAVAQKESALTHADLSALVALEPVLKRILPLLDL